MVVRLTGDMSIRYLAIFFAVFITTTNSGNDAYSRTEFSMDIDLLQLKTSQYTKHAYLKYEVTMMKLRNI